MCGIFGAWLPCPLPDDSVAEALRLLEHRGPDDSGTARIDGVLLGMRRLSIIDLEGGHQPIGNEDGTILVVCNGEIYNYRELTAELAAKGHRFRTQSDTEVLVHLYEEYRDGLCERLRGMYGFALYDGRTRTLLLGRDRFGKKPLYFARTPGPGLVFASEIKALRPLAKAAGVPLTVSAQGLYDYLSVGAVPQPATIHAEVEALPMGSRLTFDGRRDRIQPYWAVDYSRVEDRPYPETLERVRELVSEATRLRLRSDVPLGVFLSGGVDSSVVASEAARHAGPTLRTFTVAMNAAEFDESARATRTAASFGVQHEVLALQVTPLEGLVEVVRRYDQPFWDSSAIPSLAVARLARQAVKVVLTGDGGDELFAGYRHHVAPWLADRVRWVPRSACRFLAGAVEKSAPARRSGVGFALRFLNGFARDPGARHLAWTTDLLFEEDKRAIWRGPAVRPTEAWIESVLPKGLSVLRTQMHGDILVNLLSDMLVKMDIATMAASLEARSPLLDHRLAEFVFTLPDRQLLGGGRRKRVLRDAYRGIVPNEVLDGRKQGFEVPLQKWLDGELREVVRDTLGGKDALLLEWIQPDFVSRVLAGGAACARNRAQVLYALLMLELWLREHRA